MRRDPHTGQFVSDGDDNVDRWTGFAGGLASTIPAADLSGGAGQNSADGAESIIVDFSDYLDADEVFRPRYVQLAATLHGPTTASAESSLECSYQLRGDVGTTEGSAVSSFYVGQVDNEDSILDIRQNDANEADMLVNGVMSGSPSHSDSASGLAAGNDSANVLHEVYVNEPTLGFDEDDEMTVPHDIAYDNVSDHAIVASFRVLARGPVIELS